MVGIRALLPLVLVPVLVRVNWKALRSSFRKSGGIFLVCAIGIAVVSRLPYHRYWLFVVPAIPLIAWQLHHPNGDRDLAEPGKRVVTAAFVVLALLPGMVRVVDETVMIERLPLEDYTAVALELEQSLGTEQSFIHYPDKPYLPAYLPDRFAAPSVVMHYYVNETNRRDLALSQLEASIDAAAVVIDEGQLESDPKTVSLAERKVMDLFRSKLSDFPCTDVIGPMTLHYRLAACPTNQSS